MWDALPDLIAEPAAKAAQASRLDQRSEVEVKGVEKLIADLDRRIGNLTRRVAQEEDALAAAEALL